MSAEEYHHLLYKQQLEGLSAEEERLLSAWLNESAEHRRAAAEVKAIFQASADDTPPVDVAQELAAFKTRLRSLEPTQEQELTVTHRSPLFWVWRVAAAVLLLMGAVFFFRQTPPVSAEDWVTILSDTLQNKLVELPDGSRVWLNRHSTLRFTRSFEGLSERNVHLEGEAFFEVKKDPSHPFVIEAGPCNVRVLGTSFNVRAMPNEPTCDVEVRTGRVRVSGPNGNSSTTADISAGQRAVYEKSTQRLTAFKYDSTQVADWRSTEISFQKTTLHDVAQQLSHRFRQKIEIENQLLGDCLYSGYFPRADLNAVLTNLQSVFNVRIDKTTDGYLLKGGQCPR
jgi:transmembrane sensor